MTLPARLLLACLALAPLAATSATIVPPPPKFDARGWILVDAASGRVITSRNPDQRLEPASLTKLMTAYAVFRALKDGKLALAQEITISERAWRAEGSRTFLQVGTRVPVETLIQGMIVQSGNDASIALAEAVGGMEATFADVMNGYARQLGMKNSHFMNATGLPHPEHYATARDLALLARAIVTQFPEYYRWYSQRDFTWNNISQPNRNGLLDRDPTVDGMKTGWTDSAGFCLVSSARRDGMRLISVMMGTASARAREEASLALLNYGFNFFETKGAAPAGQALVTSRVLGAAGGEAAIGLKQPLHVTVPRGEYANVKLSFDVRPGLVAPLTATTVVGAARATLNGQLVATAPLYPLTDVAEGGVFRRGWDTVAGWFD